MDNFNMLDIIILVIIFASILIGLLRGFISEVVALITLIAAFVVAIYFTTPLATKFTSAETVQHMVNQTSNSMGVNTAHPVSYMALGLSFAILFFGTLLIGVIIRALLNVAFSAGGLGFGNRILGGVFGFIRGGLICLAMIFLIQLSPLSHEPWWHQSKLVPLFQPALSWLGSLVSPTLANLKAKFESSVEGITSGTEQPTTKPIPKK